MLLLLDLTLPQVSGHELLQRIKAIPVCRTMRIVVVTAYTPLTTQQVAYLRAADNVSGPLPSRLREINQLIIHSWNLFSRPCPARLACI
jgi:CheY-like chemotaxis protein